MSPRDTVLDLLAELSGRPRESITPECDLVADLELDSPKALRLLVELEEAFDIEIPDEDAAKLTTVGELVGYVVATQ